MNIHRVAIAATLLLCPVLSHGADAPITSPVTSSDAASRDEVKRVCQNRLHKVPGNKAFKEIGAICDQAEQMNVCRSVKGEPIFYYERKGQPEKGEAITKYFGFRFDPR